MPSSLLLGSWPQSWCLSKPLGEALGLLFGPRSDATQIPSALFEGTCFKMRPGPPKSAKKVPTDPRKVPKRSSKCSLNIPKMSPRGLLNLHTENMQADVHGKTLRHGLQVTALSQTRLELSPNTAESIFTIWLRKSCSFTKERDVMYNNGNAT